MSQTGQVKWIQMIGSAGRMSEITIT